MKLHPLAAATCLLPSMSLAQTDREFGSHDHGAGSLNIAIESSTVYIEFDAPWDNLVGFEHSPSIQEQKELVEASLAVIQNPGKLFVFNGAYCNVDSIDIENSMDHAEAHGEDHKAEQGDDHSANDKADAHSAVLAVYSFNCDNVSRLNSIDLGIFSFWVRFEELDVQLIGPNGVDSFELTASNAKLDLAVVIQAYDWQALRVPFKAK